MDEFVKGLHLCRQCGDVLADFGSGKIEGNPASHIHFNLTPDIIDRMRG